MKWGLWLFVISGVALAADVSTIRQVMVKVVSKVQGTQAEFRGSGLLFRKGGKRYVITSDHVVAHINGLAEHQATSSVTGESLALKFLAAEWGNGLSLLEVQGAGNTGSALPYDAFTEATTAKVGERSSFYGYPFDSTDLAEETFATLLSLAAPVPYFVFAPKLVELEAAVGEFGMSGGAAFSEEGGFLGVLAYQRIMNRWAENRVYAVPREEVHRWLEHYFQVTDKYLPYFSEPWFGQGNSEQVVLTNDGLLLMFRSFGQKYRQLIGRVEHLIILKDGPSLPYVDKRGFMKLFRKFVVDHPWNPSEYNLVDRSTGTPVLREVRYPAEVFKAFDEPNVSLFVVLGERHEVRYKRVRPLVESLAKAVTAMSAALAASPDAEVKLLCEKLKLLVKRLEDVPAIPSDPGPASSGEYFSGEWLARIVFQIETDALSPGWNTALAQQPESTRQVQAALKLLVEGFKAWEMKPAE